jgi:hypothetical protein
MRKLERVPGRFELHLRKPEVPLLRLPGRFVRLALHQREWVQTVVSTVMVGVLWRWEL